MAKKKRPTFVRTTISLPADLHKRMKACGNEVNWSGIAADAFTAEVARVNTRKDGAKMDDVVERLRASKREEGNEVFEGGRETGAEWAKRNASAHELKRLWAAFDRAEGDETDWLDSTGTAYTEADIFVWQFRPEDHGRVGAEFFENEVSLPREYKQLYEQSDFIHGFAAGAIDIWKQVSDKL